MKFRTTKKVVMGGYDTVICIGYCDLQHLLNMNLQLHIQHGEKAGVLIFMISVTLLLLQDMHRLVRSALNMSWSGSMRIEQNIFFIPDAIMTMLICVRCWMI